ncbi:hypothetical protein P691DRAFT_808051 [Macrolepiota fuliginosa MF-IS2]|uniref:Uncharacterized protein n=1 Tax=Macrolepiota fuliginosa MF-IS2 TaxID=1400762 RepID=A0A9P5X3T9_9AGAR|nr:hypothetical protein P691DRAFT_808051 [Macrolepiota fuliginosa MF-IS2]
MPSHTVSCALIKLYSLDGAPWSWSVWQDLTNIRHGLFPDDDDHLPPGWTRKDAIDVASYFRAYNNLASEDQKLQFSSNKGNSSYPGRAIWNSFVTRNWNRWGIHNLVVEELRDWEVHPVMILNRERSTSGSWPDAGSYLPKILDTLGMKLFGEEAFPPGAEVLTFDLRRCLQIIAQRPWDTIRKQVSVLRNRPAETESTALSAFADLEVGKLTKAKITRTIRAVAKWKECAEIFHTDENVQKAEEMLAQLQVIMEGLGAKFTKKPEVKSKSICKVSTKALKTMASEEDVTVLLSVYHEYFEANGEDEDEPPIPDTVPEIQRLGDDQGDFGMEIESTMSLVALAIQLGLKSGLPFQFNAHRHCSGMLAWDHEEMFKADPLPEEIERLRLHWHQLAGVHSILRSIFTTTKSENHVTGILVADEVGLGKTAQAVTLIAMLNQAIWIQEPERTYSTSLPPVLRNRPWLGDAKRIPSLPHIILCPGTLIAQWVHELKVLFLPKSVDILVYDGQTNGMAFWGPSGPLQRSNHLPHNIIIVASHSVIFNDFKKLHKPQARKGARPWTIPPPKESLDGTIFAQRFLTAVVDEAHHMRNPGNKHTATLRLMEQAKVKLIMTATPLHTAPRDTAALARLVGIRHFHDEISFVEEKNDAANIRKAKKLDDDGEAVRAERRQIIGRLQQRCHGHFLRRTTESVNWLGKPLLSLPPCHEIIGVVSLTRRETEIIEERAEAAKAAVLTSSNSRIHTKKFYLEYRTAVGYAKKDAADPWPNFTSRQEWEPLKSTKMDVCARLCEHYLKHDDIADVAFEDGQPIFPEIPTGPVCRTRHIIIYAEFPSMAPLLQNVLRLYGVESLAINGKISFDERDRRVGAFRNNANPARVLIFSSVGSAGLNLSIADVVIFFDQPWSAQDERQIRGRAHRQPQEKTVKVIHLLASDSADLLMKDVARGKSDMFNAFVNKELGEELRTLLQGHTPDVIDNSLVDGTEVDQNPETPAPKKPKAKRRPRTITVDTDTPPGGPAPKQPKGKRRSRRIVDEDDDDGNAPPTEADSSQYLSGREEYNEDPMSSAPPSVMDSLSEPDTEFELREDEMDIDDERTTHVGESQPTPSSQGAGLVFYASSPASPHERSPPTKRPRQGTVGPEVRASIIAASNKSQAITGGNLSTPTADYNRQGPQNPLVDRAGQVAETSSGTKRSSRPKPTRSSKASEAPASSPATATPNMTPAPTTRRHHAPPATPSRAPSRQPGPLDDVSLPPKSALKGIPPSKKWL